jgi:hypothetical protein
MPTTRRSVSLNLLRHPELPFDSLRITGETAASLKVDGGPAGGAGSTGG